MDEACILVETPAGEVRGRLVLAHGAGAGMHSDFMRQMTFLLLQAGVQVARFDFPYMQRMTAEGRRRPPDRQPALLEGWRAAWSAVQQRVPGAWAIGGKSMGGRMASLLADELGAAALVCLGYPFHPAGRPGPLRIEALQAIRTDTLILQGERDIFGWRQEVVDYPLGARVQLHWLADGDHDLKPRRASGFTQQQHLQVAAGQIAAFLQARQG